MEAEVSYAIIRTRYPRGGNTFWHLVLIFNLYRLPILGDILYFLRCHRFAPGFQPPLIRAGAPF